MSGSRASGSGQLGSSQLRGPGGVSARGRMSAPGSLGDPVVAGAGDRDAIAVGLRELNGMLPDGSLPELAQRYGLKPSAARPPLLEYIKRLWQRRFFITGFATARNVAMYTDSRLGQVWQILTPLLNVAVYYLIFGEILNTKRGVTNFVSFLVIGVFVFNFTQRSFLISSRVMFDSLPLIRALYFPRACLPLGYVLIELQQLAFAFVVLFVIVLASGEPLTWYWLLLIPVLILQTLFNAGASFILARFGSGLDDVSQLLPFIVRTWFYVSGVIFSIPLYAIQAHSSLASHPLLAKLLQYNPAAIYITLARNALMASQRLSMPGSKPYSKALCNLFRNPAKPGANLQDSAYCHGIASNGHLWMMGAVWAIAALLVGFVFFWRAEVEYGRG